MQITISEPEIKVAILDYVTKQGLTLTSNADVELKAGRGEHGMTATIDIGDTPIDAEPAAKITPIKKEKAEKEKATKDEKEEKEPADNKPLFG